MFDAAPVSAAKPILVSVYARWLPALLGLLLLFGWSCIGLWFLEWQQDSYAHGPVVAAVVVYLAVQAAKKPLTSDGVPVLGTPIALLGSCLYVVGRSQQLGYLHVPGLLVIAVGVLLSVGGLPALRAFSYPLWLTALMVPIPTPILEVVTGPMRYMTSIASENFLDWIGYSVARDGNTIFVGQYRLLVSEACSGLNSAYSLLAVVVVYLGLSGPRSTKRSIFLALSTLPIALGANVLRVLLLAVITYHYGEAAGQGYLHGTTGYAMYAFGIASVLLLEGSLPRSTRHKTRA